MHPLHAIPPQVDLLPDTAILLLPVHVLVVVQPELLQQPHSDLLRLHH